MKAMIRVSLLLAVFVLLLSAASAQSLGEAARKARKDKPAPSPAQKVYTNENLPTGSLSVANVAGGERDSTDSDAGQGDAAAAERSGEAEQGGSTAAQNASPPTSKQDYSAWRARFAEQKDKVQLLERELGILEREYRLRVAVFYADAGTRLRDDRKFADADRQYKSDLETKKRDLAAAKQRLEDLREEARKAGVPASVAE